VQLKNQTGKPGRFICALGSRLSHSRRWHVSSRAAQTAGATEINASTRLGLLVGSTLALCVPALAADSIQIKELVIAGQIPAAQRAATLKAVRAFYEFWNTGDVALLKQAIAESFTDRTLPTGRPQGPEGPAFASQRFRAAVPDLKVTVEKMIVAGDYITVHMRFDGHFTGSIGQTQGKGQPIAFIATDLVKVENARITDNWHIEDNLTLLEEMGIAHVAP
jgi:predicted ester cyclase